MGAAARCSQHFQGARCLAHELVVLTVGQQCGRQAGTQHRDVPALRYPPPILAGQPSATRSLRESLFGQGQHDASAGIVPVGGVAVDRVGVAGNPVGIAVDVEPRARSAACADR